ncbi:unnamed protein product [Cuscuta epithymum]|uniref:MADS-box domain-containing protein n=1 Tax=Cuscuta epithymum TaxID=186058 RepID=A0AAV0E2Y4_9ASTE|nr:unnamed protein product [Cuscuta epithymum]
MARRKIRLTYITNESQRKASYKKRKKGLLKKLEELTILCSVEACTIMYSSLEPEPVVWPSAEGVQHTVTMFRSLPDIERTRRMTNQESFVHERIQKLNTTILRLKKENREKEMTTLMYKILAGEQIDRSLDVADLNDLGWVINLHLAEINKRIETLKGNNMDGASTSTSVVGADLAEAVAGTVNYRQVPENMMNNIVIPNPIFPMNNNIVEPPPSLVGWNYEGWAQHMNMMNRNNNNDQNDPTQPGTSGFNN